MLPGDEPVALSEPDAAWPGWYEQEATRLRSRLPAEVVALEHIGSTAVPGLVAKPIVDIMVGVRRFSDAERVVAAVVSAGYEDCGGAPGRRYLRLRGARSFNVQIVECGGELWDANVLLRDYLRRDAGAALSYGQAKASALRTAATLLAYSEAKAGSIRELLARARV